MAKRPLKRKVTIVLRPRVPDDHRLLLQAVEDVFRPREIEITVESPAETEPAPSCPDEQLETAAREHAAEILDERDRQVRELHSTPKRATYSGEGRRKVNAWVTAKLKAGWRIFVRALPALKKAAEIAKDIHEATG